MQEHGSPLISAKLHQRRLASISVRIFSFVSSVPGGEIRTGQKELLKLATLPVTTEHVQIVTISALRQFPPQMGVTSRVLLQGRKLKSKRLALSDWLSASADSSPLRLCVKPSRKHERRGAIFGTFLIRVANSMPFGSHLERSRLVSQGRRPARCDKRVELWSSESCFPNVFQKSKIRISFAVCRTVNGLTQTRTNNATPQNLLISHSPHPLVSNTHQTTNSPQIELQNRHPPPLSSLTPSKL